MKKEKLEEKLPELVESPQEVGGDLPVKAEQEKKPAGKPNASSKENSKENSKKNPKRNPKRSLNERLYEFFQKGSNTFLELSRDEQERYIERFCITVSVGLACVLSSFFYWLLPPIVRVLVVPVFIGGAWWFGAKVVAKLLTEEGTEQLVNSLKVVEFYQLFEAVKFSTCSLLIAAIHFWIVPSQFQSAIANPMARTIFLSAFIWNLIGAPLYAQARSRKARLLIILIFAVPAATVTLWWVNAIMIMGMYVYSLAGIT